MGNYLSYSSLQSDFLEEKEEFCEILQLLDDKDLDVLYRVLLVEEKEQHRTLRTMRDDIIHYSQLYNAYTARTLVLNPAESVKMEMDKRQSLHNDNAA